MITRFEEQEAVLTRSVALYDYDVSAEAGHWQLENGVW